MGSLKKRGWKIVLLVFVLCVLLASGVVFGMMKWQQASFIPTETEEVIENVYALKDSFVNSYLIKIDDDFYIAIDAGNDSEMIRKEMEKLSISPEKVKVVFLTHSDGDHVGGIDLFANAQVYFPEKEIQMIDGTTPRMLFMKNKLDVDYKVIRDQEEVNISGVKVKSILTDGHTPGHTSYLINDHFLFVADALALENGEVVPFPRMPTMDKEGALRSIERLSELSGIDYIFTGHYGYTNNYKQLFDSYTKE